MEERPTVWIQSMSRIIWGSTSTTHIRPASQNVGLSLLWRNVAARSSISQVCFTLSNVLQPQTGYWYFLAVTLLLSGAMEYGDLLISGLLETLVSNHHYTDKECFHTLCLWPIAPMELPFEAYFDRDNFLYRDQCVTEFILRGVWKMRVLLAISCVYTGKMTIELCLCNGQHKSTCTCLNSYQLRLL